MTYIVTVYRIDTFTKVDHLSRTFNDASEAKAYALAGNCKAYTPFFFAVGEGV
jgi:hypothetical protein